MSLRMPSGLPARVIQVLKDYLPAELDLIDTEEGNDFVTPDVAVDNYHEWDRHLFTKPYPAISMAVLRARILEIQPLSFGSRIHAIYEIDVKAHVALDAGTDDALRLQQLAFRYATGIARVLAVQKNGLETVADPVIRDKTYVRLRELRWGPEVNQREGQMTRTATVGIDIDKTEAR